jgi:hypothetical protein
VVVENFSPGTMARLGLGYEDLQAINPGIVMVSGSVYGQTGPLAQEWGVDGHRRRALGPHLPDRATPAAIPVIPGRGAVWRRDCPLRDGRMHRRGLAGAARERTRVPRRRVDV